VGVALPSSAIEQLSVAPSAIQDEVLSTSRRAEQADDRSRRTAERAREGVDKVHRMSAAMAEISDGSRDVEKVIQMIDQIAFQTNLLALDAAVEAARDTPDARA